MRDWEEIRRAVTSGEESLRSAALRWEVPYSTVKSRAAREGWRCEIPGGAPRTLSREELTRVGGKLLARIESCLDEGRELDFKELKSVTGALRELQALGGESEGESGALTVRFAGETEEMSV